ncbi:hypothetical protein ACTL6P_04850 [Endozoicomonas acroporae]|uniref:hypothetical protein n=1 Tax=Endozoicomonas acroporae TaxID=1701104 RepID=UPI000C76C6BD|nr:hypothetical protein [Endozoicomonas acroporae]
MPKLTLDHLCLGLEIAHLKRTGQYDEAEKLLKLRRKKQQQAVEVVNDPAKKLPCYDCLRQVLIQALTAITIVDDDEVHAQSMIISAYLLQEANDLHQSYNPLCPAIDMPGNEGSTLH